MNTRKPVQYLLHLVLYGAVILLGFKLEGLLQLRAEENFLITPYFYYSLFFPILLGTLLAIPKAAQSHKKNSKVKINWAKLFIFGIPSLLILLFPAYYFTLMTWGTLIPFATLLYGNIKLHFLSGLILGYIIIDSLEYVTENNNSIVREDDMDGA
ncbi:hypothetical protein [Pseudalkalibacillus decolorationis]|uniref:hypothetical protein n=1 Tax=Pseudalkalibacillus decolorationis TaxID=163879 RepID=UPI00214978BA|nr:hypothetical protein [Pseudalkalibacillus decolorationis]